MKNSFVICASLAGLSMIFYILCRRKSSKKEKVHRIEVQICNTIVGKVIGRCGGTINQVQSKTNTRIKFIPPEMSSEFTTCVIKGDAGSVRIAEGVIRQIIKNYDENEIQNHTSDSETEENNFDYCSESVRNTFSEIANQMFSSNASQFDRNGDESNNSVYSKDILNNLINSYEKHTQKLYSVRGDGLIPVYVSAVANPEQFWVQAVKTKEHAELDRITEEMFEYFSTNPQFNVAPDFSDIQPGSICATFYTDDNRWYRAEVCQIFPNKENMNESTVDLYFLDYGESSYQKLKNIRNLHPKFLQLNFQAIECSLAHVKPTNGNWSEEAISYFEEIVKVAQWFPLMAQILYYKDGYHPDSGVPCIQLIDNSMEEAINVGDKMVSKKYAENDCC